MTTLQLLTTGLLLAGGLARAADGPTTRPASILEPLRDKYRVLLIFAAKVDDAQLTEQQHHVRQDAGGYASRDLTVFEVIGDDATRDNQPLPPGTAAALRKAVDGQDFSVVLLGKDGGVKLHERRPVSNEKLFGLIDSMPMRQHEMHEPRRQPERRTDN